MKKALATFTAALIIMTSFSLFAAENNNPLKSMEADMVLNTYFEAITLGGTAMNKFLFSADFQYRNLSNNKCANKKQYIDFLQANKGIQYDCETSYKVLSQHGKVCMAKVTMKFEHFTRVDYVTLNQGGGSWKVSRVETTYP